MKSLIVLLSFLAANAFALDASISQSTLDRYQTWLGDNDPIAVESYEQARRSVVELVLLQKALRLGGIDDDINFVVIDSQARIEKDLAAGKMDFHLETLWDRDIAELDVLMSEAIMADGDYVVGLYAPVDKVAGLKARWHEHNTWRSTTNENWTSDVQTLQKIGITEIVYVTSYQVMLKMLGAGRVDVMLSSFKGTPDMTFEGEGVTFAPIQGIKVAMPGSRHFVAANTERGAEIMAAINKGLAMLHESGEIKRAYTGAGVYNSKVEDWMLYP